MKQAVVFYSKDGSTKVAAKVISKKAGADLFELEELRKRGSGIGAFMRAGFGAAFGLKSKLKNTYADKIKEYDKIFIGTPIWAAKPAPAINMFVHTIKPKGKEIVLFSLQADPSDAKPCSGMIALKEKLEREGAKVSDVLRLFGAGVGKTVTVEEMKKRIAEKM